MAKPLIQLFAKPPVKGKAKTRLIADLGTQGALDVYLYCLQTTLGLLHSLPMDKQLWLSEDTDSPDPALELHIQKGENLGTRMLGAFQFAFDLHAYRPVILIGSDCIELSEAIIEKVIEQSLHSEVVLIPAVDGGYVLIACNAAYPELFAGIDWSTDKVLQQTLQAALQAGYRITTLAPLRDIDTLEDIQHDPRLHSFLS